MQTKIPSLKSVKAKFSKAKEIICLKSNLHIGVTGTKEFEYSEENKSWTSIGGSVTFWNQEKGYAEITRKCGCKDCPGCKDKLTKNK